MSVAEIIPIPLGVDTCYVIRAGGIVAVDAGAPGTGGRFARGLARAGIQTGEVKLVVVTHGHWDHIGSAREIRALTGARLVMHKADSACLERSLTPLPPGVTTWGKMFIAMLRLYVPLIRIPAAPVDLVIGDEGLDLHDYGVPGRVIHTPGHSPGSTSVLLDGGEAFVGDLAMNMFPLTLRPGLPIFADDPAAVVASWRRLLDAGARRVYPAHGKPFSSDVIRRVVTGHSPRRTPSTQKL